MKKNKWVVDNSDVIIAYVRRTFGGAYDAIERAKRKNKPVLQCSKQDKEEQITK